MLLWQNTELIASFFLNQAYSVIVLTLNHTELIQVGLEGHSDLVFEEEALERKKYDLQSLCLGIGSCVVLKGLRFQLSLSLKSTPD